MPFTSYQTLPHQPYPFRTCPDPQTILPQTIVYKTPYTIHAFIFTVYPPYADLIFQSPSNQIYLSSFFTYNCNAYFHSN